MANNNGLVNRALSISSEGRAPMLVTSTPELTAEVIAKGIRVAHFEDSILITAHDDPRRVVPDIVERWGFSMAQRVMDRIAEQNTIEIRNFACMVTNRYLNDLNKVKDVIFLDYQKVFSAMEIQDLGPNFLKRVQSHLYMNLLDTAKSVHPVGRMVSRQNAVAHNGNRNGPVRNGASGQHGQSATIPTDIQMPGMLLSVASLII
jgi:hypothetical protein